MPITEDPTAGEFSATPKIEFIDAPGTPNRDVRVLDDFSFTEADTGRVWVAPSGSIVNGASIPRVLWSLVGSPFTGDYVYASTVHDVACEVRTQPWRDTHYCFTRPAWRAAPAAAAPSCCTWRCATSAPAGPRPRPSSSCPLARWLRRRG